MNAIEDIDDLEQVHQTKLRSKRSKNVMSFLFPNNESSLKQYCSNERGTTAIEYGIIVGGIAVAVLAIVFNLGEDLENLYNGIYAELMGCDSSNASDRGLARGKGHDCK